MVNVFQESEDFRSLKQTGAIVAWRVENILKNYKSIACFGKQSSGKCMTCSKWAKTYLNNSVVLQEDGTY